MPEQMPIPENPGTIKVTPEIAENWLTHRNIGNRKTSRTVVDRYARAMTEGRWLVTPQGVSFDRDGHLLDGQHRLAAVMVSGVTVEMFIIPGFDRATFSVLDSGYKRNASQLLTDVPHNNLVASSARIIGTIEGRIVDKRTVGGVIASYADNDQILEVINEWPELVELSSLAKACYRAAHVPAATHLAVLAQAARTRHAGRIEDWAEGIQGGVGLDRTDPRLHLRNRFIRQTKQRAAKSRLFAYRLTVRAWNAYAAGLEMGVLRVREDEETPQIIR